MKIDTEGLSALLRKQIEGYGSKLEQDDVGTVVSVGDGIATVYGLEKAMLGELLLFPHGVYGLAMNLNEDDVGAVLLGEHYLKPLRQILWKR